MSTTHVLREAAGLHDVPCNGCTRCCQGDAVRILPHEDPSDWLTEPHPVMKEARMLAHKEDGACTYLGTTGCTIHETKPQMCREMDCRSIAKTVTWTQARKLDAQGALPFEVWRRGRDLVKDERAGAQRHAPASPGASRHGTSRPD